MRPDVNDTNAATEAPRTNLVALYFECSRALNVLRTTIHGMRVAELRQQIDARKAARRLSEIAETIHREIELACDLAEQDEREAQRRTAKRGRRGLGLLLALGALAAPGKAQDGPPAWFVAVVREAHRVAGSGDFDPDAVYLQPATDRFDLLCHDRRDRRALIETCAGSWRFSRAVLVAHYGGAL